MLVTVKVIVDASVTFHLGRFERHFGFCNVDRHHLTNDVAQLCFVFVFLRVSFSRVFVLRCLCLACFAGDRKWSKLVAVVKLLVCTRLNITVQAQSCWQYIGNLKKSFHYNNFKASYQLGRNSVQTGKVLVFGLECVNVWLGGVVVKALTCNCRGRERDFGNNLGLAVPWLSPSSII